MLILPASGSTSDGKFQIHAWNTQEPTIEAYAGLKGLSESPATGENGETGTEVVTLKNGPLSIRITEEMIAFSEANFKAKAEGRTGDIKTDPDGWQTIWSYDPATGKMIPGFADTSTMMMALAAGTDEPTTLQMVSMDKYVRASYIKPMDNFVYIVDNRAGAKDGAVFSYQQQPGGYYRETRHMEEDGKLIVVSVSRQSDGRMMVDRSNDVTDIYSFTASPNKPYQIDLYPDGRRSLWNLLPGYQDDYNRVNIYDNDDGTFTVYYTNFLGEKDGQQNTEYPKRKHGPIQFTVLGNGEFSRISYMDAGGNVQFIEEAVTVAEYNAITGQDWDGSYHKFSDFDMSFPFQATKP